MILNIRSVLLSGEIVTVYPPNQDKVGKVKFSFTILSKSQSKKAQNNIFITSYNLKILDEGWFRTGKFIFLECYLARDGFYLVEECHYDPYECYKPLMERINRSFNDDVI